LDGYECWRNGDAHGQRRYGIDIAFRTRVFVFMSRLPSWLDVQSNGHTMAYNQAAAEPASGDVIAMLDFGRQISTSVGWQVELANGSNAEEPQSWVKQVAEDFASGWQSDHSQILIEGVGTNNSDYAWSSNSNLWNEAGTDWANLVNTINNQDYAEVAVDGGSDIESWAGTSEFGSWVATGTASVHWCDGYDSVSDPQPMSIMAARPTWRIRPIGHNSKSIRWRMGSGPIYLHRRFSRRASLPTGMIGTNCTPPYILLRALPRRMVRTVHTVGKIVGPT